MTTGERLLASERGFSILTVLIAVVLVSVAVVALSGTTVYVLSIQTESSVRSSAAGFAAAYMEEIKTRNTTTLVSEPETSVYSSGLAQTAAFLRELKVEDGAAPRSKLITVTVRYPRGRAQMGRVELVTIVYEGVGE